MNRTNGKIAERSKATLCASLLTLMQQYDFSEITVTQIAQEAKLSRKTFYRLFSTKTDVLNCYFEGLYRQCMAQIQARELHHYWDVMQCYFDFCQERRDLLLLLKKHGVLSLLLEGSYRYSFQVFEYVRSREAAEKLSPPLPYMLAYSIGGMHSMLVKWIESGMDIPSAQLIAELREGFRSPEL